MQKVLLTIDRINTRIGQWFGWMVLALTLFITYEVVSRYAFSNPHAWALDVMCMFYGALFMMAGAYTLSKNGHVRGDVLYGFFPSRVQAVLDFILYFLFYFPGVIALLYAGYFYAAESWAINEHSNVTANGPPIYPFKMVIPLAGICLLLQGIVEATYCWRCIRDGEWPRRDRDVEEVDVDKLMDMVHVKSDDIQQLNQYVTEPKEGNRS